MLTPELIAGIAAMNPPLTMEVLPAVKAALREVTAAYDAWLAAKAAEAAYNAAYDALLAAKAAVDSLRVLTMTPKPEEVPHVP